MPLRWDETSTDPGSLTSREVWARSGAMALTGRADGPPLVAPDGVVDRIRALGRSLDVDVLGLMVERASIAGLRRQGATSCGGSARLLPTADGWIAVSLPRPDDLDMVPAWLEIDAVERDAMWDIVAEQAAQRATIVLVDRAILLGLAAAAVGGSAMPAPEAGGPFTGLPIRARRASRERRPVEGVPLVVDLSSLWAGPLCGRLLADRGAEVVKVESTARPDGARQGPAEFFDLLHGGHASVALDLRSPDGRDRLQRLLTRADVVIESSRPRALAHLGIDAEAMLDAGVAVWVSITGHGRTGRDGDRIAFGDDAAAGGGLVATDAAGFCFVADAAADPLSGVTSAAAAVAALRSGGAWRIDVNMADVARHVAGPDPGRWQPGVEDLAAPPRHELPGRPAPALGAQTESVLRARDAW
ncbi:MAG: CoA transferase [Acidimicrobiales bacterium]